MARAGNRLLGYSAGSPTGERLLPHQLGRRVHYVTHVARYQFASSLVEPPGRVLDSGCGTGYGAYLLAERGFDVRGVDISQDAIEYARATYEHPRLRFEVADALGAATQPEYALVTSFEVIEHLEDADAYLAGIARALRRGAKFVISTPNRERSQWQDGRPVNPCHHTEYRASEFRALLEQNGFAVERWLGQRLGAPTRRMLRAVGSIAAHAGRLRGAQEPAHWPAWWERWAVGLGAPLAARTTWAAVAKDNDVRELAADEADFFVVVGRKT